MVGSLNQAAGSVKITQAYVDQAMRESDANLQRALEYSRQMNQISDMRLAAWRESNRRQDIANQKFDDYIRGQERVIDKNTNQVYLVENGWYSSNSANLPGNIVPFTPK